MGLPVRVVWGWAKGGGMSRARVAVLQVVSQQLSVTAAAAEFGFSRRHLHRLLLAYRAGGLDALEPRSRRPKTNAAATSVLVCERVIALRVQLTADGLDAGPGRPIERLASQGSNRVTFAVGQSTSTHPDQPCSSRAS